VLLNGRERYETEDCDDDGAHDVGVGRKVFDDERRRRHGPTLHARTAAHLPRNALASLADQTGEVGGMRQSARSPLRCLGCSGQTSTGTDRRDRGQI
jgi:hypothetical protein